MSREITGYGGAPAAAPRTITFDSNFNSGLSDDKFRDRMFPWGYFGTGATSYQDQTPGEQTVINGEAQYYLKPAELLGPAAAPGFDNGRPWNINGDGHLVLRAIPTPAAYQDIAYGVINGYQVVSATSTEIRVRGQNYYDREAQQSRAGIDKFYRNKYTALPLKVKVNSTGETFTVNNIIDESGATDPPSGTETFHRIQVTGLSPLPTVGSFVNVLRPLEYVSGMMTTRGTFSQKYGSWETRCKFPTGKGAFAAPWGWPNYHEWFSGNAGTELRFDNREKSVEIDFGEVLGHAPDIWYHNLHSPEGRYLNNGVFVNNLRNFVADQGLTPVYAGETGWTGDHIQQHQVLVSGGPASVDYINAATDFINIRWDHYVDDTCALYVKKDDWTDWREVYKAHMTPQSHSGVIDERCIFLNNAVAGDFNYEQERNDAAYPRLDLTIPASYDFVIDYIRVYQWDNQVAGGAGFPNQSGAYPSGFSPTPDDTTGNSGGGIVTGGTVENPNSEPLSIEGLASDDDWEITSQSTQTETPVEPEIPEEDYPESQNLPVEGAATRATVYIDKPPAIVRDEPFHMAVRTPQGKSVDEYTYLWSHTYGADAEFIGPIDEYEVNAVVTRDIAVDTAIMFNCDINAKDGSVIPLSEAPAGTVTNVTPPIISGFVTEGQNIAITLDTWSGPSTVVRTLLRNGNFAGTITGNLYTVVALDEGRTIQVRAVETTSNIEVLSNSLSLPLPAIPGLLTSPVISGTTNVGDVISITPGVWTEVPQIRRRLLVNGVITRDIVGTSFTVLSGETGTFQIREDEDISNGVGLSNILT